MNDDRDATIAALRAERDALTAANRGAFPAVYSAYEKVCAALVATETERDAAVRAAETAILGGEMLGAGVERMKADNATLRAALTEIASTEPEEVYKERMVDGTMRKCVGWTVHDIADAALAAAPATPLPYVHLAVAGEPVTAWEREIAAANACDAAPAATHQEPTDAPAPSTSRDANGPSAGVSYRDAAGVRHGERGAVDAAAVIRIVNDHKEKSHSWEAHYDLEPCLAADCFSGGGEIYAYGASEAEARENLAIALRFTIERLSAALGAAGRGP